jgi:colanic acid/amylovoran biosynthesis glycosyltransferase
LLSRPEGGRFERIMITIVALCGASVDGQMVRINRKFHVGMIEYARRLPGPVACVLPQLSASQAAETIDLIEVPRETLAYQIHLVPTRQCGPAGEAVLEDVVGRSQLVYCGSTAPLNRTAARICRRLGLPYVVITEYTLRTQLDQMRASTPGWIRRRWRALKLRYDHRAERRLIAAAAECHANGYPTYHSYRRLNPSRLLFFDSRLSEADIIPESDLLRRLEDLENRRRPPRLIYSGRYAEIKGALDVVKVGLELRRRRRDFRLDLFGVGPLKPRMCELVRSNGAEGQILIHDAVPFSPDLIGVTRQCDLFICCHVQGDPSCTYLETFGSGVPIAGYPNEMWTPLCAESRGGITVRKRDPVALGAAVDAFLSDPASLKDASFSARRFANRHHQERMWDLRCSRLIGILSQRSAGAALAGDSPASDTGRSADIPVGD